MIVTYTLWLRAVKYGSVMYGLLVALSYFYMVASWGGYVFVTNIIPLHAALLIVLGRYSARLHIAYTSFYILATLLSMQVFFVGFRVIQTSDHLATHGVFAFMQAWAALKYLTSFLSESTRRWLFVTTLAVAGAAVAAVLGAAVWLGYIAPFSGRFYSMFDPTYASKYIPIIASVSEHQPTVWTSYFFDTHVLIVWFPVGIYHLFRHLDDQRLFLVLYGLLSCYFSGVMVRLMLVLTPALCIVGAIGVSFTLDRYMAAPPAPSVSGDGDGAAALDELLPPASVASAAANATVVDSDAARQWTRYDEHVADQRRAMQERRYANPTWDMRLVVIGSIVATLLFYQVHCTWVTQAAYSSPSIVISRGNGPNDGVIDDFREAYYWLRQNTPEDAKIMSWWDYGYQISGMANRTTLVDNNTWNNSHIAQVGQAFSSNEQTAYKIVRSLDVDYVLVVFGGFIGYSSDDINKFLWMVRIGGSTDPRIKEADYYTPRGEYRIDAAASPTMQNCLMYLLSYYRFDEVQTHPSVPAGFDRVRQAEVGRKKIKLTHFEEAYTSDAWIVRIYKVLDPAARGKRQALPPAKAKKRTA
jgi:dolichyl-diphosphooligosaccharide--protein glycosyltransferase